MLINTIFNKINQIKSSKLFFVSPHAYSIGNSSEQLDFAILKASNEGKKVYVLYPFDIPFLFKRKLTNIALLNLQSDLIYYQNPLLKFVSRLLVSILMLPARWFDLFINIFGYSLSQNQVIPLVGDSNLYRLEKDSYEFSWERLKKYNWPDRVTHKIDLEFSPKLNKKAKEDLLRLGVPINSWFVCLHVRESGFKNDSGRREYRNSTIDKYIPAIKEITKMGGIVIRLGDKSMKPLPKMDKVIDYPYSEVKSDLMDIYLIKHCRFYIATSSGIYDTAVLLGKKILMTNCYAWIAGYPLQIHSRGLIKHVYSKKLKRFLTLNERISSDWSMQEIWGDINENYILFENSSNDIRDAVIEYINLIFSDNFSLIERQDLLNKKRIDKGKEILDKYRLASKSKLSDTEEIVERYRIGSRLFSSKGSVSNCFIEKYWNSKFIPTDEDDIEMLQMLKK